MVKFFNYEGYLMGIILADVIILGQKNNYSFCIETTKPMIGTDLKAHMNYCVNSIIQELKDTNFEAEKALIAELEELIIK